MSIGLWPHESPAGVGSLGVIVLLCDVGVGGGEECVRFCAFRADARIFRCYYKK